MPLSDFAFCHCTYPAAGYWVTINKDCIRGKEASEVSSHAEGLIEASNGCWNIDNTRPWEVSMLGCIVSNLNMLVFDGVSYISSGVQSWTRTTDLIRQRRSIGVVP